MELNHRGDYQSPAKAGISLISLVITVIVIIILAAIVIFTGLSTPDRANFAKFTSEFSDFQTAVEQDYYNRYQKHALANGTRSKAQIYYEIASNDDKGMEEEPNAVGLVAELPVELQGGNLRGTEYFEITDDTNVLNWKKNTNYYEPTEKHYVTDEGEVFTLPGYLVDENGEQKWYVNASKYYVGNKVNGEGAGPVISADKNIKKQLKIGDWVAYKTDNSNVKGTDSCGWRVWAIEGNNVIIKPIGPVGSLELGEWNNLQKCFEDWKNCETIINNKCKEYTNSSLGITASNIRSLTIEDLENENVSELGTKKGSYTDGTEGNAIEYADGQFGAKYNASTGKNEVLESLEEASESPIKLKSNYYYFQGDDIGWKTIPGKDITYGELFNTGDLFEASAYAWLASPCVRLYASYASFLVRVAFSGGVSANILFFSIGGVAAADSAGVAPLVSLSSKLIKVAETTGDGSSKTSAWVLELAE